MKTLQNLIFVIFTTLLTFNVSLSQSNITNQYYPLKFRLTNEKIVGGFVKSVNDSSITILKATNMKKPVIGYEIIQSKPEKYTQISLNDLMAIGVNQNIGNGRNSTLTGGLIGVLGGIVIGLVYISGSKGLELVLGGPIILVLSTVVGGIIGAVIGSNLPVPHYTTIYTQDGNISKEVQRETLESLVIK